MLPSPTLDPDPAGFSLLLLLQHLQPSGLDPIIVAIELIILVFLLFASALFSGSEVALFSLDGSARLEMEEAGDQASMRVLKLLEQPRQVLVTILILNTTVNVCAAIISALLVAGIATALGWSHLIALIIEMVALTFALLVLSEISPKLIATRHALAFSRRVSRLLLSLHRLICPLSNQLARSMAFLQKRLKNATARHRISTEDLKTMAEIGEAHGTLEEEERDLIYSIVEFGETTVREIMVSRLDIQALPVTATLSEALDLIKSSGHSRLPLFVDHLDNILGIIYAKDLLPFLNNGSEENRLDWTRIARSAMFVPQGKMLDDLLRDFQAKKTHMAIVVDEYGGTSGLVSMEDVLEEIVGDIRDEHDPEEALFQKIDDSTYRFDARVNLDEVNEIMNLEIDTEEFDFETLGGLIFHVIGAIPTPGDKVTYDNLEMVVETVVSHRIGRVLVHVQNREAEDLVSRSGEGED